jgi:hypothetical protein
MEFTDNDNDIITLAMSIACHDARHGGMAETARASAR